MFVKKTLIVLAVMRGAAFLLALLATVSTIRTQEIPEKQSLLTFPDGSLPELAPRRKVVEASEEKTRADGCPNPCPNFTRPEESDPQWRLSRDVLPSHYEVSRLKCGQRLVTQNFILRVTQFLVSTATELCETQTSDSPPSVTLSRFE